MDIVDKHKYAYRETLKWLEGNYKYGLSCIYEGRSNRSILDYEDKLRFELYALKQLIMDETTVPDDFKQEMLDKIEDDLAQLNTPLSDDFKQQIIREIEDDFASLGDDFASRWFNDYSIRDYAHIIELDHWISNPYYRPRRFHKNLTMLLLHITKEIVYSF